MKHHEKKVRNILNKNWFFLTQQQQKRSNKEVSRTKEGKECVRIRNKAQRYWIHVCIHKVPSLNPFRNAIHESVCLRELEINEQGLKFRCQKSR